MSNTDPITTADNSLIKSEPVIAATAAASVVGYLLAYLVTHHIITSVQASASSQQLIEIGTAAFIWVFGALIRTVVTPAAKVAERVEQEVRNRLGEAHLIAAPTALNITPRVVPADPAPVPPLPVSTVAASLPTT